MGSRAPSASGPLQCFGAPAGSQLTSELLHQVQGCSTVPHRRQRDLRVPPRGARMLLPLHPVVRQEDKDQEQLHPPQMQRVHHNLKIQMPPSPSYGAQRLSRSHGWGHSIGTCQGVPLSIPHPQFGADAPIFPWCPLCVPPHPACHLQHPKGTAPGCSAAPLVTTQLCSVLHREHEEQPKLIYSVLHFHAK